MLPNIEQSQEKISDKEKLKQVKEFINEAKILGINYGKREIKQGEKKLNILDASVDDTGSKIHFYIEKKGDKVFEFNLDEAGYVEKGKTRTTGVSIKIDGKKMSYSGNYYDEHGIYNNFYLLDGAKKYLKEAQDMIILDETKHDKKQEIKNTTQNFKNSLDELQSSIN